MKVQKWYIRAPLEANGPIPRYVKSVTGVHLPCAKHPVLCGVSYQRPHQGRSFGLWRVDWKIAEGINVSFFTGSFHAPPNADNPLPCKAGPFWLRAPIYEMRHRRPGLIPNGDMRPYKLLLGGNQPTGCPAQLHGDNGVVGWSMDAGDNEFVHPMGLFIRREMFIDQEEQFTRENLRWNRKN